jgi:hypothetical protein
LRPWLEARSAPNNKIQNNKIQYVRDDPQWDRGVMQKPRAAV